MAGATLKKTLPGTPHFFDSDYTRARPQPRLEICIEQIRFSDSLPISSPGKFSAVFLGYTRRSYLTPAVSWRLFLPPGVAIV